MQEFKPKVIADIPVIKEGLESMRDDIKFSKWFIGIVGIVVIVATTIVRGMDNRSLTDYQIKTLVAHVGQAEVKELK